MCILNIKVGDEVKLKNKKGTFKVASLNKSHVRFEQPTSSNPINVWYEYKELNEKVMKC